MRCHDCDCDQVREDEEFEPLVYGVGADAILIQCIVPVIRCQVCDFAWTDYRAEEIRDAAVQRYKAELQALKEGAK